MVITSRALILIGVLIGLSTALAIMAVGYVNLKHEIAASRSSKVVEIVVSPTPAATPSAGLKLIPAARTTIAPTRSVVK